MVKKSNTGDAKEATKQFKKNKKLPTNKELMKTFPLDKVPNIYRASIIASIEDDSKKTKKERELASIKRLNKIEKMQYKYADKLSGGKKIKEIAAIAKQNKENQKYGMELARKDLTRKNKSYRKKQKGTIPDTGSEYRSGGRVNLRGGGISQRGLGKAFKNGGRS
jgi:hypothetical protein|tara:strand:+ start:42 stop:536 length:495 start_codon:yes stop_codon:yes gene_type:complete